MIGHGRLVGVTDEPTPWTARARGVVVEVGWAYLVAATVLVPVFLALWAIGGDRRSALGYAALVAGAVMLFAGAGLFSRTLGREVVRSPVHRPGDPVSGPPRRGTAAITSSMISVFVGLPLLGLGGLLL